jgi:hypothetical protein
MRRLQASLDNQKSLVQVHAKLAVLCDSLKVVIVVQQVMMARH